MALAKEDTTGELTQRYEEIKSLVTPLSDKFNTLRGTCIKEDSRIALLKKHASNPVVETSPLPAVVEQSVPQPHTPIAIHPSVPKVDPEIARVHASFKNEIEIQKHYPKGKFVTLGKDGVYAKHLSKDNASLSFVEDVHKSMLFKVNINGVECLLTRPRLYINTQMVDSLSEFFTISPNTYKSGRTRLVKPAILSEQGELLQLGELAPL